MIYLGTSGLVLPVTKAGYPPEFAGKSRLEYYASLYDSIEINSTFYKLPMQSTIKRWTDAVPDAFHFTFKLSKTITHVKHLDFNYSDLTSFFDAVSPVGSKAGCLLIQFPPALQMQYQKLQQLLSAVENLNEKLHFTIALEFRHTSWYHEKIYRLLESHLAAMVMHDITASAPPADTYESETVYLRFHGPDGKYRGSYDDDFLYEYASYIKDWEMEGKSVYAYFNNTMGDASRNLKMLIDYIASRQNKSFQ